MAWSVSLTPLMMIPICDMECDPPPTAYHFEELRPNLEILTQSMSVFAEEQFQLTMRRIAWSKRWDENTQSFGPI